MKTGKRILSLLLSLMLVLGAVSVGGISVSADGYVYEISTYSDLRVFADRVNSGETSACAKLMNDIVATCYNVWTPIGKDLDHKYIGTFDGDCHVITGLSNADVTDVPNYVGLFGYVGSKTEGGVTTKGTVKNVGLVGGAITGNRYVGGVVGYNNGGSITNCYNTGDVTATGMYTYVGGVVGYNEQGTVKNCYNTGSVSDSGNSDVGGVVGRNTGGSVTNCYNTGSVSGNSGVGGVVGYSDGGSVTNCYNTGVVSGINKVGGVVGEIRGTVENCYNTGAVSGNSCVGGVAGYNINSGSVTNCYNAGDVSGTDTVGGVAGFTDSDYKVTNCYYDKSVCGEIGAVRGRDSETAKGLTTAQMTGDSALDNMTFAYEAGVENPWLAKENGQADGRNIFYFYYPHLSGINPDSDRPARLEITVNTTEFTYTGTPEHPLKKDIIIVSGSMEVPDEFKDKTVTYSRWNEELSEWKEILDSSVENPGRYRVTVTWPGETEVLFERCFTVLETGDISVTISAVNGNTSVTGADAGDYEAKIQFAKYGNIEITVPYKINPADAEISVTAEDANCGEMVKATVTASAGIGNNFTVTIEKQKNADEWEEVTAFHSGITNGTLFEIGGLSAGDYRLTASYDGGNYKACSASDEFSVNTLDPGMTLTYSPEEPVYLELATVTANLPSDAEGTVTFTPEGIDDLEKTVDVSNGKAVYEFRLKNPDGEYYYPGAGTHNIKAEYSGDDKYSSVTLTGVVTIAQATPEINLTVSPENPVYGDSVIIEAVLYENASGNVTFTVTGDNYNFTSDEIVLKDGVAQIELDSLIPGNYTVKADYTGDDDFNPGSKETTFTVGKIDPGMTVTVTPQNPASDGTFTLTVNLPDDATGNVIIRFNEVDLLGYIKLAEGNSQQFNCLQSGRYSGTAKYMPDDGSNYKEVTVEFSFNVSAAAPNMTLTAEDITYGETATVTANLPRDTMWGSVTFYLDSADTGKEVSVSQGKAVCTFAGLNAGEHTVEAVFANDDKYADETKTITFNVAQKELTITANDQSYPFNNQMQGEDGTTYTNSADISEKVTVDDPVTGDTLTSIVLTGQAKDIDEYEGKIVPSSAVIKNSGGRDVTTNYDITYTAGKLTITSVNAPLTVNYVYAKGGEAAETHTEDVEIFTGYSVTSPEITGYTPDKATVEGTMESLDGVTETVTYTPIEYTATFVDENGETVEAITFTVETESITEPAVPEKAGYAGEWEEYTLGTSDITIKPVYANITSIQLENYEESSETGYKEDKTFTVKADDLPEGAEIHWYVNGEDVGTGESYTVEDPTDDYNIYAEVIDKDGNTLDTTKVQSVKVRNGFFDRLKAFFAELIEKILGKAIADLLTSIC
jgi:hypothetical protein